MRKLLVFAILLFFLIACKPEYIAKDDSAPVRQKFDGYNWSWSCGGQSINFTLWKENTKSVTKLSRYWLIQGDSSDQGDLSKKKSNDESGSILIIYNAQNDSIINWIHGKQIPPFPDVDSSGTIVNKIDVNYC